ncbi:hypothetical protein ACOSP6_00325 [Tenacibaculum sp. MEBiC06402]|uniref:hypothetical protein n=2 Tax=unclassified Tenacibaculum TaxID=2635139 RepID=UPI003B9D767A
MNRIKTEKDKFNFTPAYGENKFLNIKIDGVWIDEKFNKLYPNNFIEGTIPTLSYKLQTEIEEKIVWKRFLPAENTVTICPILMCPDDCDFECSLIVAEIENSKTQIRWNRIGLDKSETYKIKENVGSDVEWFKGKYSFEFERDEYLKVISNFKRQYEIDKIEYEEYCKKK